MQLVVSGGLNKVNNYKAPYFKGTIILKRFCVTASALNLPDI